MVPKSFWPLWGSLSKMISRRSLACNIQLKLSAKRNKRYHFIAALNLHDTMYVNATCVIYGVIYSCTCSRREIDLTFWNFSPNFGNLWNKETINPLPRILWLISRFFTEGMRVKDSSWNEIRRENDIFHVYYAGLWKCPTIENGTKWLAVSTVGKQRCESVGRRKICQYREILSRHSATWWYKYQKFVKRCHTTNDGSVSRRDIRRHDEIRILSLAIHSSAHTTILIYRYI